MSMSAALRAKLDTVLTVATVTWTDPVAGESEPTPSKTTRTVRGRIEPLRRSRYEQMPEGKRSLATELLIADSDAALTNGEYVGAAAGPYAGQRWEVVHDDPVHGHHYEAELLRVYDLPAGSDPLA